MNAGKKHDGDSRSFGDGEGNSTGGLFPYGFKTVTAELDKSIGNLNNLMTDLIRLSEAEKICNMLADEIEKTKDA